MQSLLSRFVDAAQTLLLRFDIILTSNIQQIGYCSLQRPRWRLFANFETSWRRTKPNCASGKFGIAFTQVALSSRFRVGNMGLHNELFAGRRWENPGLTHPPASQRKAPLSSLYPSRMSDPWQEVFFNSAMPVRDRHFSLTV